MATDTGAITLIQRFAPAAHLNIHLHSQCSMGLSDQRGRVPVLHEVPAPGIEELPALLVKIITHHEGVDPTRRSHCRAGHDSPLA